jgi:hypothetical protein
VAQYVSYAQKSVPTEGNAQKQISGQQHSSGKLALYITQGHGYVHSHLNSIGLLRNHKRQRGTLASLPDKISFSLAQFMRT